MCLKPVVVAVPALVVAGIVVGLAWPRSAGSPRPVRLSPVRHAQAGPVGRSRRPQFVVVSFDGSGGSDMFEYWRAVARRVHAHFTFFVSGVYLVDWAHNSRYDPPRHRRGRSDIGFAPDAQFAQATLAEAATAYDEGHEIGTHFNGHFCAPFDGNVDECDATRRAAISWFVLPRATQARISASRSVRAFPFTSSVTYASKRSRSATRNGTSTSD